MNTVNDQQAAFCFVSIGECMVELAPAAQASDYTVGFAGDTFNTAWYVKSLAATCTSRFVSRVGRDAASDNMLAMMSGAGIDTDHVVRSPDRSVGLYMISLQNGERSFSYWRDTSAARQLAQDRATLNAAMSGGDVIYFTGITMAILDQSGRDTLLDVVRDARAQGQTIVFDSNLRPRLWANDADMTRTIMQAAAVSDIVLPSFDDEATFFGDADMDATRDRYLNAGATSVIVKNGEGAVHYAHDGQTGIVHPAPATDVIDTTSAGDSFNAGVLVGMNSGLGIEDAIRLGASVAAQVISRKGALVALPADVLPANVAATQASAP